jgi:hypothetical protein
MIAATLGAELLELLELLLELLEELELPELLDDVELLELEELELLELLAPPPLPPPPPPHALTPSATRTMAMDRVMSVRTANLRRVRWRPASDRGESVNVAG